MRVNFAPKMTSNVISLKMTNQGACKHSCSKTSSDLRTFYYCCLHKKIAVNFVRTLKSEHLFIVNTEAIPF